jgi:hypothetical protein
MARSPLGPQIWKETRALAPAWLACAAAMSLGALVGVHWSGGLEILVYFGGASALGALSIGHDYSLRTLGILLAQPAKRQRLLLVKLGVLAVMLLALFAVGSAALGARGQLRVKEMPLAVPLLWAFFVAPWLTMVAGSAMGGAVFTMTVPWMLVLAGELIGVRIYGDTSRVDGFRLAFLLWGTLVGCASGAVLGWRKFIRLEAIDGRGVDLRLPAWFRIGADARRGVTRRHPYWLLIKKELRLQQLALAVAAIAAIAGAAMALTFGQPSTVASVIAPLYVGLIAMVTGSLASAEERRLGTLDWQLLVPVAAWKQWLVKVAVVAMLVIAFAVALPAIVTVLNPATMVRLQLPALSSPRVLSMLVVLSLSSLYVSSLCASSLWALLVTPAAIVGVFGVIVNPVSSLAMNRLWPYARYLGWRELRPAAAIEMVWWLVMVMTVVMFSSLGLANHRTIDRSARRIVVQSIVVITYLTAASMLWAASVALL